MKRIKLPASISKMRLAGAVIIAISFLTLMANAQICGPATIDYVVRDTKGNIIDATTLKPENFVSEKGEFWKREVRKIAFSPTGDDKNTVEVQAIEYVGGNACAMKLDSLTLSIGGKTMQLIFDLALDSYKDREHSHRVIDSLSFRDGQFTLFVTSDNFINSVRWLPRKGGPD